MSAAYIQCTSIYVPGRGGVTFKLCQRMTFEPNAFLMIT